MASVRLERRRVDLNNRRVKSSETGAECDVVLRNESDVMGNKLVSSNQTFLTVTGDEPSLSRSLAHDISMESRSESLICEDTDSKELFESSSKPSSPLHDMIWSETVAPAENLSETIRSCELCQSPPAGERRKSSKPLVSRVEQPVNSSHPGSDSFDNYLDSHAGIGRYEA